MLILGHGEDAVHPLSSALALHELVPHAQLETAASQREAEIEFPAKVATWLRQRPTER